MSGAVISPPNTGQPRTGMRDLCITGEDNSPLRPVLLSLAQWEGRGIIDPAADTPSQVTLLQRAFCQQQGTTARAFQRSFEYQPSESRNGPPLRPHVCMGNINWPWHNETCLLHPEIACSCGQTCVTCHPRHAGPASSPKPSTNLSWSPCPTNGAYSSPATSPGPRAVPSSAKLAPMKENIISPQPTR